MFLRFFCLAAAACSCVAASCDVEVQPPPSHCSRPLDRASGSIEIRQSAGMEALVVASVSDAGCPLMLEEGQGISVNGHMLSGPSPSQTYVAAVPASDSFTIRINEPTRGVSETVIDMPFFDIQTPAPGQVVSITSLTIAWTNSDPELGVRVTLRQVLQNLETTRSFGPYTDTGSLTLTPADFSTAFRQGADLSITVTRINTRPAINGLRSGTVTAELSRTVTVTPAP
jgi:hypothetical protein